MRPPPFFLTVLLIPALMVAACSSTPSNSTSREPEEEEPLPDEVPNITGERVKLEWKNLRRGRQDPMLGLINRSSPELAELYRNPKAYSHIKPVDDQDMGVMLAALDQIGYFDHATEGVKFEDLVMGDAKGVVALTQGDRHWALLFREGQGNTPVPTVYYNSKMLVIEFHRRTLWFAPTQSQQSFQLPSKYQKK